MVQNGFKGPGSTVMRTESGFLTGTECRDKKGWLEAFQGGFANYNSAIHLLTLRSIFRVILISGQLSKQLRSLACLWKPLS